MTTRLTINEKQITVDADPEMPLLWVLRDLLGLSGTKYGCGAGHCGACTVHLGAEAVRSCTLPLSAVGDRPVTTIEGIGHGETLHPVQQAWISEDVPQCGYCQSGQIMQAIVLLQQYPSPSEEAINRAMQGNLCRCGTYPRIKKAIQTAVKLNS